MVGFVWSKCVTVWNVLQLLLRLNSVGFDGHVWSKCVTVGMCGVSVFVDLFASE